MPNLARELHDLAEADRRIAEGESRLERMRHSVHDETLKGFDTSTARAALEQISLSLDQFRVERQLISDVIDDIRAGRLPST
jgi:hypothetical protein